MEKITFTAQGADAGLRLDSFIAEKADALSRSRAKTLIKEGAVTIDGVVTDDPRKAVVVGSAYTLALPAPVAAVPQPEDIPLDILFEDEHLIIINKPSGMAGCRQDRACPCRPLRSFCRTRYRAGLSRADTRRAPPTRRHD